jgi:hypothetical protein
LLAGFAKNSEVQGSVPGPPLGRSQCGGEDGDDQRRCDECYGADRERACASRASGAIGLVRVVAAGFVGVVWEWF